MDIKNDIKSAEKKFKIINIELKEAENNEVYPNIKNLVIGHGINIVHIKNEMFPNVRSVKSENDSFISGKPYLATDAWETEYDEGMGYHLLNTFCLRPDETLDLKSISEITPGAFDGCNTLNVINTENINAFHTEVFEKSAIWNQPFDKYGCVILGTMLIKIDKTKEDIEIPSYVTLVGEEITFENVKHLKIHSTFALRSCWPLLSEMPETLILAKDCEYDKIFWSKNMFSCKKSIEVESDHASYKSIDGILYGKSYNLLRCPYDKTGYVKIPEGVGVIEEKAFYGTHIQKVSFPDTLRIIKEYAFLECEDLEEVHFGNGITEIGGPDKKGVFEGTKKLKHVSFPKQIKTIGYDAFIGSGLKTVKLNDGLESIGNYAFANSNLQEITLPGTVCSLHTGCLNKIPHVILRGISLPIGFQSSIAINVFNEDEPAAGVAVDVKGVSLYIERPSLYTNLYANDSYQMDYGFVSSLLEYADKNEVAFAKKLIQDKNYENFLHLLRINKHDSTRLRELLTVAQEVNDTTAAAYIMKEAEQLQHENFLTV